MTMGISRASSVYARKLLKKMPDDKRKIDGCWNGHLVVTVAGFLIDPTLYQIKRPA
jgi:hypothetical protein